MFPNTGDDWAWGSSIGADRLESWFTDYNGRYAGNLLVMALTRSKLLNIVTMAFSYYAVCLIASLYSGSKKPVSLLFSLGLFFVMPKAIFTQSVVWTAGFSNYVPPILIACLYILTVKNIFENKEKQYPKYIAAVTFLMGFIGSLFMENVSVFFVVLAIVVLIISYLKSRKIRLEQLDFLIGSVLGCVLMFSNSAYYNIANGNDGYRDTPDSFAGFVDTGLSHLYTIFDNLIISNRLMCAAVSVITVLIAILFVRKSDSGRISNTVRFLASANIASVAVICLQNYVKEILKLTPFNRYEAYYKLIMFVFACVYLGTLVLTVFFCVEKSNRLKMLFPFICVPVIVAPLLVVNPIGPRCFFSAYMLLMLFAVTLFDYMLEVFQGDEGAHRFVFATLATGAAGVAVFYLAVFSAIHSYDVKRSEFAKLQSDNGEKTVIMCELPNNSYLWTSEPKKEPWAARYKLFYGLDEDVTFEFVERKEFDEFVEEYTLN